MFSRLRAGSRPSPAIIVAAVALVAAVAGTAVADPVANTSAINKKKVKKIANKEIGKQFPIQESQIADGAVSGDKIADGGVGAADLGTDSVGAAAIAANVVGTSELGTITPRSESYTIEDDATPHERQEVDCNNNEQAISGDVSPFIIVDQAELNITESNYDPNGGSPANDTGWIFGLGNMDDVVGVGDADDASLSGTLTVLCLAP